MTAAGAKIIALSLRAADQGIVHAVVQAANSLVVISLLVDFETSSQETLRWKLFDCEPDGVRCMPKSSVPNGSSPGFLLATGEQLRRGVIIKFDYGLFDRDLFDRHLFELTFSAMTLFSYERALILATLWRLQDQAGETRLLLSEIQVMRLLNTLVTPVLSGSVISVVIFCASAVSSLVCAVIVSKCLRACAVDSSKNSGTDFTASMAWA